MGKPLFMMSSVTQAMKAKQILIKNGIPAEIERTPKREKEHSCGYSLFVPKRTDEAEQILEKSNIKIIGRTDRQGVK